MAGTRGTKDGLRPVERTLVECVESGYPLDLTDGQPIDEQAMRSWAESRTVRASVIRDILRGRLAADPDPHGVRLRGARIDGRLDLANITSNVPLWFEDCLFDEGISVEYATLSAVMLGDCRLEHPDQSAFQADGLVATVLVLRGTTITANTAAGTVRLHLGAHLGRLDCSGASLRNDSGPALLADDLRVDHVASFGMDVKTGSRFEAEGIGDGGAMRLPGANLGALDCSGASLRNESGPALIADRLRVDHRVHFKVDARTRMRFEAVGIGDGGAMRLPHAHFGALDCSGASLRNDSGPALIADGLRVDQEVFFDVDEATGLRFEATGEVRLVEAHFERLEAFGASLRNDSGPALIADGLRVDHGVYFKVDVKSVLRFEAVGSDEESSVRLTGAHLGRLDCSGASLRNNSGPALFANLLRVDDYVFLRVHAETGLRFEAVGSGANGAVMLIDAQLGRLECDGAMLHNNAGSALDAEGLRVDQAVFFRRDVKTGLPFEVVGFGSYGALELPGAHVDTLVCSGASLRNDSGPALNARRLQVDQRMTVDSVLAVGSGNDVVIDLGEVEVGGTLTFQSARVEHLTKPNALIRVDGLSYSGLLQGISTTDWLRLIREGTPEYAAQPYQQLVSRDSVCFTLS